VPSGLDATSGQPWGPCIEARATATLALPKTGLLADGAGGHVGQLYLADIGVPLPLLLDVGVDPEGLFAEDDIMRLT
jgi:NAD(P)H-hydrate epimerase